MALFLFIFCFIESNYANTEQVATTASVSLPPTEPSAVKMNSMYDIFELAP
jgi:hypothetical protein